MKDLTKLSVLILCLLCCFTVNTAKAQDPTVNISSVTTAGTSTSTISINWVNGNGNRRLITCAPYGSGVNTPDDGSGYTASSTYGVGTNLGSSNYCVYNGTSTGTTIFGLSTGTQYTIRCYEYNLVGSYEYYMTSGYQIHSEWTLATAPSTQTASLTSSSIATNTVTLSWTGGGGTNDLISLRQSSSYLNTPVDGTDYVASSSFTSGDYITGTSPYPYVVYDGTSTVVGVSNLSAGTTYTAAGFTYNGTSGANNYYTSSYPVETFTTMASQPTSASSNIAFSAITDNSMLVSWTLPSSGGGTYRIVTCKPGTVNTDLPVDATSYTASSIYGLGTQIGGGSGAYVVYSGSGNYVNVTGLSATSTYSFSVYEYNVAAVTYNNTTNYYTSSYLNGYQSTLNIEPTVAPSALSFSSITSNSARATWANGNGARRIVGVASGRKPTGVAFDGTNDYVAIPNESLFDYDNSMTMEAWIKVGSFTVADQAIVTKGNDSWRITRAGSTNSLAFTVDYTFIFSYTYTLNGTRNVNDGKWHHVAATYNGSQMILYIDGTIDAYSSFSYAIDNSTAPVQIGGNSGLAGKNFNGQIDEVRLWDNAQSQTNIRTNMNKTLVGNELGLTGYWKLDDGFASTTTAKNSTLLSGLDGTLTSFASTTAATNFTSTSGWVHSGATVNCPADFSWYVDNPVFMSATGSSYYFGNLYYTVYRGPDSTTINVTGLSPSSYYTFKVFDYNGVTGNNNYLTSNYAIGEVFTSAATIPTVTSFTPATGMIGTVVTINGTGFNATAANNTVYFGATKATIISANAGGTQLTVQVPMGATFEPISVTNNTLTAWSSKPFVVTSTCSGSTIAAGSMGTPSAFSPAWFPADQTFADIDLDGKSDLVSVYTAYYTSVARNTSTTSSIIFGAPYYYYNATGTYSDIVTADFDGDGKIDIAVNNRTGSVSSILASRNTSAIAAVSFGVPMEFPANSTNSIVDIQAADFDKDGKPDIIVCYNTNLYSIFRNTSSAGTISFAPKVDLTIAAGSLINTIALGDLDGDNKIDLAFATGTGNNVTTVRNTCTVGTISFSPYASTAVAGASEGLAIGNIDNDGKLDIVCGVGTSNIAILRNTSSGITISMASPTYVTSLANTVTDVNLGDIDGDGKADIGVGYASGTQVSLFQNNTVGAISIGAAVNYTTASSYTNPGQVSIGDLNGDSKADMLALSSTLAYSVYQNTINPLAAEPTTPATNLLFSSVTTSQIHLDFDPGTGANKVVFVREATTAGSTPIDGVNYVPNTVYGGGDDLGGGNYCVFNGNGNSVTVTGLLSNTLYTFTVYEYNGASPCTYNYMGNSAANFGSQATDNTPPTLTAISDPASICQGSGLQTINLTGIGTGAGTEVQTITITASSSNTGLIPTPSVSYVSPATTGTLSYTPVPAAYGTAIITVTVNDGATNNNILVETFTVTVDHTPTTSNAGPNQEICPGVGTLAGNAPAFGTGFWTIIATTNGAITITDPFDPTTTVNNFLLNDSATFRWTISNGACPSSGNNTRVKRKNCPTTADFTVNSTSECLSGSPVVTYTDASVASGGSIVAWSWSFGAGAFPPTATGIGPHMVTYSTAGAKTVSLQVTDNLAATDIEIKAAFVNINDVPEPSGNISGPVTACQGENGVVYTVPVIAGATGYTWSLPSGAVIISGVNTNSITVNFGAGALSGNLNVRGTNACGNGTVSANFPVTVSPLPSSAGSITGLTSVCDGATGVTYSISAITNATGYVWSIPSGAVIMSGTGTTNITVNYLTGSAGGMVTVYGTNTCGNGASNSVSVIVNPYPDAADVISGPVSITDCPTTTGVTYSIPLVNNAVSYDWTVPLGATIVGGTGTNVITVDFGPGAVSGDITVTPENTCGDGLSSTLSIIVNTLPESAGILSGNDSLTICPASNGIVYSVPSIFNADNYIWSLPAGAIIVSGDSTNTITVDFGSSAISGDITVYGENACGMGASSTLFVNIPSVQTQDLCMVTVDNTSSYNKIVWEKPATMDIDSFRIYREITSSFVHIASVHYDSLSEYNDSVFVPAADPNTTNFRYKISVIDTCGNESMLSTHHRTIFLQANQGVGGVINLNWVPYEGATVSFYRILRDTIGAGAYVAIDSVPGSNTVYTDNSPPSSTSYVDYMLESNWTTTCTPTRATVNTTRSNIKHVSFSVSGVAEQAILNNAINVYPNPASNELTLEYPSGFKTYNLYMFDALGQIVYNTELADTGTTTGTLQHKMDVSTYTKGIYIISLQTEYGTTFKRLVIQ